MTMWRMCVTWWILNATNTRSEYVTFIAVPLQQWLHERSLLLRYTHIACALRGGYLMLQTHTQNM